MPVHGAETRALAAGHISVLAGEYPELLLDLQGRGLSQLGVVVKTWTLIWKDRV